MLIRVIVGNVLNKDDDDYLFEVGILAFAMLYILGVIMLILTIADIIVDY